nr:hypothetical protein [Hyphomonas sp.]
MALTAAPGAQLRSSSASRKRNPFSRPPRASKKATTACSVSSRVTALPTSQRLRDPAHSALRASAPLASVTTSVFRSGPPLAASASGTGKLTS